MEQWVQWLKELVTNPGWVAVIVSAVMLTAMIVIYKRGQKRKGLSYEVLSQTPLVRVEEAYDSELEILYDGQRVDDVTLMTLKVVNSGNVPITEGDYERPVVFSFGQEDRALSADVLRTNPKALYRESLILKVGKKVSLAPDLLNPGDWIEMKVLVAGLVGEIDVDGRIVGVKEIAAVKERRSDWFLPAAIAGLLGALASPVIAEVLGRVLGVYNIDVVAPIGVFFGVLLGLLWLLEVSRRRSRSG